MAQGVEVRHPELGRVSRIAKVAELCVGAGAVGSELRRLVSSLDASADGLRPGVLLPAAAERQQEQPRAVLVAGQPGDDGAGPIQANQALFVSQLRADASGELVRVRGRFRRKVRRPELDVQVERRIRRRNNFVQQIASRQEVQNLAHLRGFIVHHADVHQVRQRRLLARLQEAQHLSELVEILRIRIDDGLDVEDECFGRGERRGSRRHFRVVHLAHAAREPPAIRVDPRNVGGARHIRQESDPWTGDLLKRRRIRRCRRREALVDQTRRRR